MTIFSKLTRYTAAALLLGTIYAPASAQDYFISNAKLVTNGSDNIVEDADIVIRSGKICLLYTSPSPRDRQKSRMPSSA